MAYTRQYSFTDWQTGHPTEPLPGSRLDSELDDVATGLAGTLDDVSESVAAAEAFAVASAGSAVLAEQAAENAMQFSGRYTAELDVRATFKTEGVSDVDAINNAIAYSAANAVTVVLSGADFVCSGPIFFRDGMSLRTESATKVICNYDHPGSDERFIRQTPNDSQISVYVDRLNVDTAIDSGTTLPYRGGVFVLNLKDSLIRDPRILRYRGLQGWIVQLENSVVERPYGMSLSPTNEFGDGFFRQVGGFKSRVVDLEGYCNDDLAQFVPVENNTAVSRDKPVRGCVFDGVRGESRQSNAVIALVEETAVNGPIDDCAFLRVQAKGAALFDCRTDRIYSAPTGSRDGTNAVLAGPITTRSDRIYQTGEQLSLSSVSDPTWTKTVTVSAVGNSRLTVSGLVFTNSGGYIDRPSGNWSTFAVGDYISTEASLNTAPRFRITAISGTRLTVTPAPASQTVAGATVIQNYPTLKFPDAGAAGNAPSDLKITRVAPLTSRNIRFRGTLDVAGRNNDAFRLLGNWDGADIKIGVDNIGGTMRTGFVRGSLKNWKLDVSYLRVAAGSTHGGVHVAEVGPGKLTGDLVCSPTGGGVYVGAATGGDVIPQRQTSPDSVQISPRSILGVGDGKQAVWVTFGTNMVTKDIAKITEANSGLGLGVRYNTGVTGYVENVDVSGLATTTSANKVNFGWAAKVRTTVGYDAPPGPLPTRFLTASTGLGIEDLGKTIVADATLGTVNVNLPPRPALALPDFTSITVKKVDASANTVTVTYPGSGTVQATITQQGGEVEFWVYGAVWTIKKRYLT
jgi:hypothetical protein